MGSPMLQNRGAGIGQSSWETQAPVITGHDNCSSILLNPLVITMGFPSSQYIGASIGQSSRATQAPAYVGQDKVSLIFENPVLMTTGSPFSQYIGDAKVDWIDKTKSIKIKFFINPPRIEVQNYYVYITIKEVRDKQPIAYYVLV